MCIGLSTPPQKHIPLLSCQAPPLNRQTVQTPLFRQPSSILVFPDPPFPLKVGFFSKPSKYYNFSSLMPSYLLKVTKFLDKISKFEFLVMTEKNIFAYKLFLSLNISDFNLFFVWKLQLPLKKGTSLFPSNPPLKVEILSNFPFWKFGWRFNPPPPPHRKWGRGQCTLCYSIKWLILDDCWLCRNLI